ncbi:hypothetical protein L207DRAFT_511955 [Hyaloscypha variabilis F]|uniref:Uncharacterized protein n=1 Tax=Hyaloscypha variabilis (strain UAMH 11265 / GT02V1 / F) TaxID=1149755 RepID=A0A2J6RPN9_HYAVF|nr:hypothetical protein L207DRAFT_511955 [Hyaloscypha variabilis F]
MGVVEVVGGGDDPVTRPISKSDPLRVLLYLLFAQMATPPKNVATTPKTIVRISLVDTIAAFNSFLLDKTAGPRCAHIHGKALPIYPRPTDVPRELVTAGHTSTGGHTLLRLSSRVLPARLAPRPHRLHCVAAGRSIFQRVPRYILPGTYYIHARSRGQLSVRQKGIGNRVFVSFRCAVTYVPAFQRSRG